MFFLQNSPFAPFELIWDFTVPGVILPLLPVKFIRKLKSDKKEGECKLCRRCCIKYKKSALSVLGKAARKLE
ncbi:hypothetical protein [uncultured Campylobacter sp.]|uniref:hypothetical protein n=1 Tax=uncultured Campylobacter sp. TaxID=218934 RepID=UPI003211C806